MRLARFVCVFVSFAVITSSLFAQSPNGNINGLVSDSTNASVTDAEVVAVNDVPGVQYPTKTNCEGIYVLPNLPPGPYRVQVSKLGFKTLIKPDITLNVQDSLSINFTLLVGAFHEIVTVQGGAPIVNTESAAVSTVVDRKYIENMPLNGRSFQDLILLTPGVVTNNPQSPAGNGGSGGGEFSVNGQRTESNVYTVDGVSANIGAARDCSARPATSGSVPNSTALGTTQSLVSVDALQEFRVQSSTYSAEFGRNPGGQFSFVTRSGSNEWHGSAFDYLRNSVFDANDWFNDYLGQSEPALRQNDFGGTIGGPLRIPFVYDGKDRTFFFFSYEGLRVVQPQASTVSFVPDLYLRTCTPSPLQQVLNAFPQPTSPAPMPDCSGPDASNGIAQFVGTWSNSGNIDGTSIRFDHMVSDKLRLFFRFSDTPSSFVTRIATSPSQLAPTSQAPRSYTACATSLLSNSLNNECRLNYSSNKVEQSATPDGFGGAIPVNLLHMQGFTEGANQQASVFVGLDLGVQFLFLQQSANFGQQRQWN